LSIEKKGAKIRGYIMVANLLKADKQVNLSTLFLALLSPFFVIFAALQQKRQNRCSTKK
jgi:hypothetical protein